MGDPAEDDPATFVVEAILTILLVAFAFLETLFWVFGDLFALKTITPLSLLCFGIWAGWHLNKWKESDGN